MTDTVYKVRDNEIWFQLTVFMAQTNCFQNFKDFLRFIFISYGFCSSMT